MDEEGHLWRRALDCAREQFFKKGTQGAPEITSAKLLEV